MKTRVFCTAEEERVCRAAPMIITPSNIDQWQGSYEGDARYSLQQLYRMRESGIDPETVDFVEVSISARMLVVPIGRAAPWRKMACPIIGTKGGRLLVISPYGAKKLVYPNGERTRPHVSARPRWAA